MVRVHHRAMTDPIDILRVATDRVHWAFMCINNLQYANSSADISYWRARAMVDYNAAQEDLARVQTVISELGG